jgi:hypothetical protein
VHPIPEPIFDSDISILKNFNSEIPILISELDG